VLKARFWRSWFYWTYIRIKGQCLRSRLWGYFSFTTLETRDQWKLDCLKGNCVWMGRWGLSSSHPNICSLPISETCVSLETAVSSRSPVYIPPPTNDFQHNLSPSFSCRDWPMYLESTNAKGTILQIRANTQRKPQLSSCDSVFEWLLSTLPSLGNAKLLRSWGVYSVLVLDTFHLDRCTS